MGKVPAVETGLMYIFISTSILVIMVAKHRKCVGTSCMLAFLLLLIILLLDSVADHRTVSLESSEMWP